MTMDKRDETQGTFTGRPDPETHRAATRERVTEGSALGWPYLAMNAAATFIAAFGLLENSAAVIIGAMMIAMLFGPILGIALGLAEGNMRLLARSLVSEVAGAAWVLAIGFAVGCVAPRLSMGSEILARTSPNLFDLLIGLVGGLAGGFTLVSPGLSGVIVGVAIATALVPPLTSCGILLAHHLPALATGALLLFLANFSAITIGAMAVFWLAGHRARALVQSREVLVPRLLSIVLLGVLAVHFALTFRKTITRSMLENGVRTTISRQVAAFPGARLVEVTISASGGVTGAWAVVRTPRAFTPAEVARLNDVVDKATGTTVDLHVRSVITAETTRRGNVYESGTPPIEDPGPP